MTALRNTAQLFTRDRRARLFFLALTQSSLGSGAAYVGMLLIAYERFESPWAITAVLLADLAPSMLAGPLLGAMVDRWSRRACMVVADVIRAGAFIAIPFVPGIEATIALALLAGVGNALFKPASLAALPSLVERDKLPAATSTFGAISDFGFTAGPVIAAGALLIGSAGDLLFVNGLTYVVSAVVLATLHFGDAKGGADLTGPMSLLREARDGIVASARIPGIRVVIAASATVLLCGGLFNVAELLFAKDILDAGESGYSVLVAVFGLGFVVGSLLGAGGGAASLLKRRYLLGLLVMGLGFLLSGFAPSLWVALGTFALAGLGNGLLLVYERLLIQHAVSEELQGRVYAVTDTLVSWGFGIAFVAAGALIPLIGVRELVIVAGALSLGVAAWATLALRSQWVDRDGTGRRSALRRGAHALR